MSEHLIVADDPWPGAVSNEGMFFVMPDRAVTWKLARELEPGDRIASPWLNDGRLVAVTRTAPWTYGPGEYVEVGWDDPTFAAGTGPSSSFRVDAVVLVFLGQAPTAPPLWTAGA